MSKDTMTERAIRARLRLMKRMVAVNTKALDDFLHLPPERRIHGKKRDGTDVTVLDYKTNARTLDVVLDEFPEDSFDGEEIHMIRPGSEFTFLEDPVDATAHAITYDERFPTKHCWATYLLSLLHEKVPVAVAFGVPLRKELYWGSVPGGMYLNGAHWSPKRGTMVIHEDRTSHDSQLKEITGYDDLHIAGVGVWLIIQGYTAAGICPFPLPHESACLGAAARCMGATVTNRVDGPFDPYKEKEGMKWKF